MISVGTEMMLSREQVNYGGGDSVDGTMVMIVIKRKVDGGWTIEDGGWRMEDDGGRRVGQEHCQ